MQRRFGKSPATTPRLSPQAKTFLRDVAASVARALWDEIDEIGRAPLERGSLFVDDQPDPEMPNMRQALGVAGYAIFYTILADDSVYVTLIKPWDFDAWRG